VNNGESSIFEATYLGMGLEVPRKIAQGGDQIVFELPGTDNAVLKVSHLALGGILGSVAAYRTTPYPRTLTDQIAWDQAEVRARLEIIRYYGLVEAIGTEHVPREKLKFGPLLLNGRACRELWGTSPLDEHESRWFWTTLRYQEKVPALEHPELYNTQDLRVSYPERKLPQDPDRYIAAARKWIQLSDPTPRWTDVDEELLLDVYGTDSLRALLELMEQPEVSVQVGKLLDGLYNLTEIAGESPDANRNNIILYQDPQTGQWNYSLPDALIPRYKAGAIDTSRAILRDFFAGHSQILLRSEESNLLANTLPVVAVTNALRKRLGRPSRVELGSDLRSYNAWWQILRALQVA